MKLKELVVNFWDTFILRKYKEENTKKVFAKRVIQHNLRYSKFLITFSFAAIVLILVLLKLKGGSLEKIGNLETSWYLFFVTVFVGLFFHGLHVMTVLFEANYNRLLLESNQTGKDNAAERSNDMHSIFTIMKYMYKSLTIQTALFFVSTLVLIYFYIFNF
jgi:hypothetical protein